jgi:hypothetical protein
VIRLRSTGPDAPGGFTPFVAQVRLLAAAAFP